MSDHDITKAASGLDTAMPNINDVGNMGSLLKAEGEWDHDNHYYDYERKSIADQLGIDSASWRTSSKAVKHRTIDSRRGDKAIQLLQSMPDPMEYIHIVTGKEFSGFDLLMAMFRLSKAKQFEKLTITTLGYGVRNIQVISHMVKQDQINPNNLKILASDFFRRAEKHIWNMARSNAQHLGYGLRSQVNHTKIILAILDGKSYVSESSANLRSCSCLEQFMVTQNRDLFNFHQEWIDKIWTIAED